MSSRTLTTRNITKIAILSLVSFILMEFEILVPFTPPFYKLDVSEVVIMIGAFAMGPLAGVIIELLKNIINLIIDGSITGGVGELSNFLTACAFVVPASLVYKKNKNKKSARLGLLLGVITMTIFGYFSNRYVMIPIYSKALSIPLEALVGMGTKIHSSIDSVTDMILLCVVPFNLIKGVLVSVVTFILYKKIRKENICVDL